MKNNLSLFQILALYAFISNYLEHIKSRVIRSDCRAASGWDLIFKRLLLFRLYGSSGACAVCAKLIPATEFVMKVLGKVYHINCFNCTTCHNQLVAGDRFHVVNGRLFCENDDPRLLKQQLHATKQTVSKKPFQPQNVCQNTSSINFIPLDNTYLVLISPSFLLKLILSHQFWHFIWLFWWKGNTFLILRRIAILLFTA